MKKVIVSNTRHTELRHLAADRGESLRDSLEYILSLFFEGHLTEGEDQ